MARHQDGDDAEQTRLEAETLLWLASDTGRRRERQRLAKSRGLDAVLPNRREGTAAARLTIVLVAGIVLLSFVAILAALRFLSGLW